MSPQFIDDQTFHAINFNQTALKKGTYENCEFHNCNFTTIKIGSINFVDCQFTHCDFSNAKLTETGIQNSHFQHCKLIGLRFDSCNTFLFAPTFKSCKLDFSSFYNMDLKKCIFQDSSLESVDFGSANLSKVALEKCNLSNAIFEQTNLIETDFRTAINFNIEPTDNQLAKAKFSLESLPNLLRKYNLTIEK